MTDIGLIVHSCIAVEENLYNVSTISYESPCLRQC